MNRTSINLLCSIFLVVLAASILTPAFALFSAFSEGIKDGMENNEIKELGTDDNRGTWPVTILIDEPTREIPALQNDMMADSGDTIHTHIRTMDYRLPDDRISTPSKIAVCVCAVATIIFYLIMAFKTIRFVVAINRKQVFDRRNIMRLTWIGILLLGIALSQVVIGLTEDYAVGSLGLTFGGYGLTSYWTIPWTELLLGLMALLMAQVWRRGCQLKEEQELTI